jgi:large subunit ribosomal protein L7/L12
MSERLWSPEIVAIGDRIVGLSMIAAAELSRYLAQVHGVRPAGLSVERKPIVDVIDPTPPVPRLVDVRLDRVDPARKVALMKLVRDLNTLTIKEAKDMVEGAPRVVRAGLSRQEAETLRDQLRSAGAEITLVEGAPVEN